MDEITLGSAVKDRNSPITGLVTGRMEYLNATTQFLVTTQNATTPDGNPVQNWFEGSQLQLTG